MALVGIAYLAHRRGHLRHRRSVPVQSSQGALPGHVPHAIGVLHAPLPQGGKPGLAVGLTPWWILSRLLLGLDARHVLSGRGQSGSHGCAHRRHGDRKDHARRQASQSLHRDRAPAARAIVVRTSCLADTGGHLSRRKV